MKKNQQYNLYHKLARGSIQAPLSWYFASSVNPTEDIWDDAGIKSNESTYDDVKSNSNQESRKIGSYFLRASNAGCGWVDMQGGYDAHWVYQ